MTDDPGCETYWFVCLDCGYGWESAYEIRYATLPSGEVRADYYVAGLRVPSPLTHSVCAECGGLHIRIRRPGRGPRVRPRDD